MSSFDKYLSEANFQTLYKTVIGEFKIEIVDADLTPTVHVSHAGKTSSIALDKLGVFYADEAEKFYTEALGDEVTKPELNDLVIEAHLFRQAENKDETPVAPLAKKAGPPNFEGKFTSDLKPGERFMNDDEIAQEYDGFHIAEWDLTEMSESTVSSGSMLIEWEDGSSQMDSPMSYGDGQPFRWNNWYPEKIVNQLALFVKDHLGTKGYPGWKHPEKSVEGSK